MRRAGTRVVPAEVRTRIAPGEGVDAVERAFTRLAVVALVAAACSSEGEPTGPGASTPAASSPTSAAPTGASGTETAAEIEAEIAVEADPIGIASGEGSLWVVNARIDDPTGSVSRIDPASGEVLATIEVGAIPLEVAVGEGGVWVSNAGDDTVSVIDPSTDEVVDTFDVCAAPEGIAFADGAAWVVCEDDAVVAKIDPRSGEILDEIEVGLQPRFVTAAFDSIWVSNYFDGTITRIDPRTGDVLAEIETGQGPQVMLEVGDALWVTCLDVDVAQRIDPATNEIVAEVETAIAPDGMAFDGSTLWVATELGPELTGIDPATDSVVASATVAEEGSINANQIMVFEDGALWLPILGRGTVLRVAPAGGRSVNPAWRVASAAFLAVTLAACGEPVGRGRRDGEQRYRVDAFVLDDGNGAELCLGGVNDSLPPQCSGLPLDGWDWDAVEGEDSRSGQRWGQFDVVGTYDGTTFTVLEAGPARDEGPRADPIVWTSCPEPDGGWTSTDPARTIEDDLVAAMQAAEAEEDSAGFWIDNAAGADGVHIVNAAFTGDLEAHEADLREIWGGPICMVEHPRTQRGAEPDPARALRPRRRGRARDRDDVVGDRRRRQRRRAGRGRRHARGGGRDRRALRRGCRRAVPRAHPRGRIVRGLSVPGSFAPYPAWPRMCSWSRGRPRSSGCSVSRRRGCIARWSRSARMRDVASDAVSEAFAQAISRGSEIRSASAWIWRTCYVVAQA